jgi:endonuclease YncB( thermonuclease family)
MELDRDTLVLLLLGLVVAMEFGARLALSLFPKRAIVTRPRHLWRLIRVLQAVFLLVIVAGLYYAYENPATPPGMLERWLQRAEILSPNTRDDSPEPVDSGIERLPATEGGLQGRVMKIIDGDSAVLGLSGGGRWEIRLHGIDAPEYDQSHGDAAESALRWKVLWRRVDVQVMDVDSYGRRVVVLRRKSRDINLEMVCEGHAWWYVQYASDDTELKACQESARNQDRGLWAEADPLPPWEWRRQGTQ